VNAEQPEQQVRRGLARHDVPDALRNDVRLLGGLLGTVLREAGGDALLADVEQLRELTIRAHDEDGVDALDQAEALVRSFSPPWPSLPTRSGWTPRSSACRRWSSARS